VTVPFFSGADSLRQRWPKVSALLDRITEVGHFTNGPVVQEFERAIEVYAGAKHAVAVGSATDALIIMLRAAGIGRGDEVITPCFTFFASASSIAHVGATPVFVDIDPLTYNIDPQSLEASITERTRAIMPVHLFTQMADMPTVERIATEHGLLVLEDSAEGIGMWCDGKHAGLIGQAGVLSFFPTKTLGAIGDAGMILTDDELFAQTCRLLRSHGQKADEPYMYHMIGYNSRMDDIQAAILLVRLQFLARDIAKRAALAGYYSQHLQALAPLVRTPWTQSGGLCGPKRSYATNQVYYVYLIEAEHRDELVAYLTSQGIGTEIYYPIPLHMQPCFAHLGYRQGDFPIAERACTRTVALPLYPDMTMAQVEAVCQAIKTFYERRGSL
jgi:UDP-2-acetamido-2-deoxy-ribo-hexuluronate aminotransferase